MTNYILTLTGELYHSGIKGMKWGVRRFQNPDGTLTSAGKKRCLIIHLCHRFNHDVTARIIKYN